MPCVFRLLPQSLDQLPLFGQGRALALVEISLGPGDDVLVQCEPASNLKRVGLADVSNVQSVAGLKRFDVELHRGVLGPAIGQGVRLQITDVGRDDRPAAQAVQLVEDRPPQRGAFGGIGSGTQLIQQHQRAFRRVAQNLGDAANMG